MLQAKVYFEAASQLVGEVEKEEPRIHLLNAS